VGINWAKKLQQVEEIGEKTPEGDDWFTSDQFREKSGFGKTRTHQYLRALIKQRKAQVFKGSQWNREQKQLTRKVWYRFL
tara:strand:- start:14248 stop:14487 length:240 start_codon:yes stop_codon:yes gene_type:complete